MTLPTPSPKISVIVATWNQADTIGRALDSILGQRTAVPYEIIIGEDASPDDTRRVCEEYADRYPDIIRLMPPAPNNGVTRNYFDCLEAARGEYIADLAGDDRWTDMDKLQRQADFLDSHPEAVLVHTAWHTADAATGREGSPIYQSLPEIEDGHATVVRLLRHDKPHPLHMCTSLYRRKEAMEVYNSHRSFMRAQLMEDLTLSCLLLEGRNVGYIPADTLAYTVGGKNSVCSPADAIKKVRFYLNSLDVTCVLAEMTDTPRRSLVIALKHLAHYTLSLAMLTGRHEEVRSVLAMCRRHKVKLPLKSYAKRIIFAMSSKIRGVQ